MSPSNQFGGTFQVKPFRVEFSDNKLTGNAGLVHLGRFAKKLGVQEILERRLSISRGENATYDVPVLLTMLMMGALNGVKHLSQMLILKGDGTLRKPGLGGRLRPDWVTGLSGIQNYRKLPFPM